MGAHSYTPTGGQVAIIGVGAMNEISFAAGVWLENAELIIHHQSQTRFAPLIPHDIETITWQRMPELYAIIDSLLESEAIDTPAIEYEAPLTPQAVVLATGDPMWYGLGATLVARYPKYPWPIEPGVSVFSLAAARMRWEMQTIRYSSVHGQHVDDRRWHSLQRTLLESTRHFVISHDARSASTAARILTSLGAGDAEMTVLSMLGHPSKEEILTLPAKEWIDRPAAAFSVIAIAMQRGGAQQVRPFRQRGEILGNNAQFFSILATTQGIEAEEQPQEPPMPSKVPSIASSPEPVPPIATPPISPLRTGLPDDAWQTDGLITPRWLRLHVLSFLQESTAGDLLWDLGAGSGSIAIEWTRGRKAEFLYRHVVGKKGRVRPPKPIVLAICVERESKRIDLLEANIDNLVGAGWITHCHDTNEQFLQALGEARAQADAPNAPSAHTPHYALPPAMLHTPPSAIFIGGGLRSPDSLRLAYSLLPSGGRLASTAVTLEGVQTLSAFYAEMLMEIGGQNIALERWQREHVRKLGRGHSWQGAMPVTLLTITRP